MKLSVIMPLYKEPYLQKTIDSLLENSELGEEVEIICVFDSGRFQTPVRSDSRVKVIVLEKRAGMRGAVNAGLAAAKGDFIMKCDAHCCFGPGFDRIMVENGAENRLLIPRQHALDTVNWKRDESKPSRDYIHLTFPLIGMSHWARPEREKYEIDDTMMFTGSCWMAQRKYFLEHIGFMDDRSETYGPFIAEPQEIGLKYWLGGGEVKINKKTWYAHFRKRKEHYKARQFDRSFKQSHEIASGITYTTKHWMNNEEPNMIHPISWLFKKFAPLPGWPDDWEAQMEKLYGK